MSNQEHTDGLTRRTLIKSTALGSLALAAGGLSLPFSHPDRLNYPMKRVGKRGEGKFVRISWEEALDTIADNLKRIVKEYGNEAVYINYSSGIVGGNITRSSPYASLVARLMNCYGGFLSHYGTYSTAQISCAMPYTYGSNDGNSTSDIENSKLVVMFGNNPAETRMSGGGITYYLERSLSTRATRTPPPGGRMSGSRFAPAPTPRWWRASPGC